MQIQVKFTGSCAVLPVLRRARTIIVVVLVYIVLFGQHSFPVLPLMTH
jgi:hypothetical protein